MKKITKDAIKTITAFTAGIAAGTVTSKLCINADLSIGETMLLTEVAGVGTYLGTTMAIDAISNGIHAIKELKSIED